MAQEVVIAGELYSAVPSIEVPKNGGGTAKFVDVSATTATADKILTGYGAYSSSGVWMSGTATGGTGGITQDANGYLVVDPDDGGVAISSLSVTANGTYTASSGAAYNPVVVNVSGGASEPKRDVNFYDYDGTIVASYSASDFANLSALPSNPSHTGLTAQGWNWSLSDAKAYVASYGMLEIGQMYTTASGATEIDVVLDDVRKSPYVSLGVNGTVSIDWGDGSTASTLTGTSLTTQKNTDVHNYSSGGQYTIKITPTSGSKYAFLVGNNYNYSKLFWKKVSTGRENIAYTSAVKAIRVGNGVESCGNYCFGYMVNLESITLPNGFAIPTGAFQYNYSLKHVNLPNGSDGQQYAFEYCSSLKSISLPSGMTTPGYGAFECCYALCRVTIPNSVTSISTNLFSSCWSLQSVSIPSSSSTIYSSCFSGCNALRECKIPATVTSLPGSMFYSCMSLVSITVPSGVTSIGSSFLNSTYSLKELHMLPTTPPTLASSTSITNQSSDLVIYVPTGTLSDYQTASSWSVWANNMVEE